jgi:hypothetical protein
MNIQLPPFFIIVEFMEGVLGAKPHFVVYGIMNA